MKFRIIHIVFYFLCTGSVWAQPEKYRLAVHELFGSEDSSYAIPESKPLDLSFDAEDDSSDQLSPKTASLLHEMSRRNQLKYSRVLQHLAVITLTSWKDRHFKERKKLRRIRKALARTMHQIRSHFGILQAYSFEVPVVNHNKHHYFYDRKGSSGGLNLYKGSKDDRKSEDFEYVPLDPLTDTQILELVRAQLKRRKIYRDLQRGLYSYLGVFSQTDSRTLYRNKIPKVRIVIFLGARRLQGIRKP